MIQGCGTNTFARQTGTCDYAHDITTPQRTFMRRQRISLPIGGNYSTHDAISASASVRELSKDVSASGARAGADATAHYRNRRFYWLRVKLYAMVEENELKSRRETRNGGEERETASYHPGLHGKIFCLYMPRAIERSSNFFGYPDHNSRCNILHNLEYIILLNLYLIA